MRAGPDASVGPRLETGVGLLWVSSPFLFLLFFFCKQTSLNSNKFEFKLPSTQPKLVEFKLGFEFHSNTQTSKTMLQHDATTKLNL